MRWTTVFALFLLAGISPCSSDASQSASPLSTTDPPTADIVDLSSTDLSDRPTADDTPSPSIDEVPDAVTPSTTRSATADENYDNTSISKSNDTGDSTALADGTGNGAPKSATNLTAPMDSVDSEGSLSLKEEASSMTPVTISERAMENEVPPRDPTNHQRQLQASSSAYIDPSDETSRAEDKDMAESGEVNTPSSDDDSRLAPSPHHSSGSHAEIKSQALVGGSPSTPNVNLTDGLEGLSYSELSDRLDKAKLLATSLKTKKDRENATWVQKKKEADESKNDYDKKKDIWEGLSKIAKEKGERWQKDFDNNRTATREHKTAEDKLKKLDEGIIREQGKLDKFPARIQNATGEREKVEKRDATLAELNANKTKKNNGKPALEASIPTLTVAESDRWREWNEANDLENTAQRVFNDDGCNKPENLEKCSSKKSTLDSVIEDAKKKKKIYETTKETLANAKNELDNFDTDMEAIQDEIDKLEDAKPNYEHDLKEAKKKEAKLRAQEITQKNKVEDMERSRPATVDEEGRTRIVRDEANEKVKNGRPPDVEMSTNKANEAFLQAVNANNTMIKIYGELAECKTELDNAEASLTTADSNVAKLTKLLKEAKTKEAAQGYGFAFNLRLETNI